jgi:hypothetical protein
VVNLTTQTIEGAVNPIWKKTSYGAPELIRRWCDFDAAVQDLQTSLEYHPDFTTQCVAFLQELGYSE